MKRVVLDESALLALLEDRAGAAEVEECLTKAVSGQISLLVLFSSWSAVCSRVWRAKGKAAGDSMLTQLTRLPISLVPLDSLVAKKAAELTAEFDIPLLQSFSAALAILKKAVLTTVVTFPQDLQNQMKIQRIGGSRE